MNDNTDITGPNNNNNKKGAGEQAKAPRPHRPLKAFLPRDPRPGSQRTAPGNASRLSHIFPRVDPLLPEMLSHQMKWKKCRVREREKKYIYICEGNEQKCKNDGGNEMTQRYASFFYRFSELARKLFHWWRSEAQNCFYQQQAKMCSSKTMRVSFCRRQQPRRHVFLSHGLRSDVVLIVAVRTRKNEGGCCEERHMLHFDDVTLWVRI